MNLDDIAGLLAEKINQKHFIKHYLNNVFMYGFQLGVGKVEDFAIDFYEWRSTCLIKNIDQYTNKEAMELYKQHIKETSSTPPKTPINY